MDQTVFNKAEFTKELKQHVHKQLETLPLKEMILSMLYEEKSGVELTQLLHVRKVEQIVGNEGLIYTLLHEAEAQNYLNSSWKDGVKYYQLTKLGKNQIQQQPSVKLSVKERILGVRMHVE